MSNSSSHTPLRVLVLGTRNEKKRAELCDLLQPLRLSLRTLADYPQAVDVEETGQSFAANAALKATVQSRHLSEWVLGEDSGLVVPALDGAPGIYSARYSGAGATDETNNRKLLRDLAEIPSAQRAAYYVCHMTLADPQGEIRAETEGMCHGRIRPEPAGTGGFGYDPLFELPEYHRTFGELGPAVKAVLSHRARAIRRLIPHLEPQMSVYPGSAGTR